VHRTRVAAVAAGRRYALKSGGAEVVIHGADGRVQGVDPVGAATLERLERGGEVTARPQARAPRSAGPRTTLRLPPALAALTDRLARELGISRNDALLRLATRGARLFEHEEGIAARRRERWAAVVPGAVEIDRAAFPAPDEARSAILQPSEDGAATPD
jgi:hypothetical protein